MTAFATRHTSVRRGAVRLTAIAAVVALSVVGLAATSASADPEGFANIPLPSADSEQIAFSGDGRFAYVTQPDLDQVVVLDVATSTQLTTIAVGDSPLGVAGTPDGSKVYVTHWNDNSIVVIDPATNTVVGSPIVVGSVPHSVVFSPDSSTAYISSYGGPSVTVVDVATGTVTGSITTSISASQGIAISPDGSELWISMGAGQAGAGIDVASTATNTVTGTVILPDPSGPTMSWPNGLAMSPDGSTLYAVETNDPAGKIYGIDTATRTVDPTKTIATPYYAASVEVSKDGATVWAAYGQFGTSGTPSKNGLIPVNSATGVAGATIETGAGTRDVAVSPDNNLVYVLNQSSRDVTAIGEPATRISGSDRYDVGVRISAQMYPQLQPPSGRTVFIATGENYPDALSAGPVAAQLGAPLLLTPGGGLPTSVRDELIRLGADQVYIVGGPNSVSPAVENALNALIGDANVDRLQGADRFAASRAIVEKGFPGHADTMYITTGYNYPDALSASAAGAGGPNRSPVLLVNGGAASLDAATLDAIADRTPGEIRIAGGPNSVSLGIEAQLEAIYGPIARLGGADRFEASFAINDAAFPTGGVDAVTSQRVFVATGYKFPDALAGAPLAGLVNAPLFVVPGTCIPQNMLDKFTALGVKQATLIGGPASLTQAVFDLTPC